MTNYKKEVELENLKHSNKMEQLNFEFDSRMKLQRLVHDNEMEMQRIRNASIQRTIAQKSIGGKY